MFPAIMLLDVFVPQYLPPTLKFKIATTVCRQNVLFAQNLKPKSQKLF